MTISDRSADGDAQREETLISRSFAPPRSTGDVVSRPRLLALLDAAAQRTLTIVTGEPASGKTSLAVDWVRPQGRNGPLSAWLTLPHRLDDEMLFWRYLLAALASLDVRTDDLGDLLADGEPPDDRWVIILANRLALIPDDSVVVIDDLHQLDNPSALAMLQTLVERVPSNVHFLILSRAKPPWPLSEWRVSGRVEEIDSIDLRFTLDEVHSLVSATPGLQLADQDMSLLLERTEGWTGGIKLAMLSMRKASDPAVFLEHFAADDELVSSYLFRGVLERQDPGVRDFLLDISILELITPEICDALRNRTDGAELLSRCRSENLFLVELPGTDEHYRLHSLFAQLLQATLRNRDARRVDFLHRRASEVFEARGDVRSTVAHAVAAGDGSRTAELIARYAGGHAHRGEWDEISSWLTLLRASARPESPETTMALAITLGLTGGGDEAIEMLDAMDTNRMSERMRHAAMQLRAFVLILKGAVDRLAGVAEDLRRPVPDGDFVLPFDEIRFSAYVAGVGAYLSGDLPAARVACERATERRERPNLFYVESPGWLALVAYAQGKLSESERFARMSLARHREVRSGETAVSVPAHLALAGIAWERDHLDDCEQQLVLARRTVRPLFWERVLIEDSASRLRISRGDLDAARLSLDEVGRTYLAGDSAPQLQAVVARRSVDVALRSGLVDQALSWAGAFHACDQGPLPAALQIRIAVATGASDVEEQTACGLSTPGTIPARIDTLLAAAEAVHAGGDADRARDLVAEAAGLAEPEGFVRKFCEPGSGVATAVRDLGDSPAGGSGGADAASPFFLGVLAGALGPAGRQPWARQVDQTDLVDGLTDRELEVLDLLVAGRSYTEIGAELFVSRNTVKTHVRHVYAKLGVVSRSEASSEAKRLRLV